MRVLSKEEFELERKDMFEHIIQANVFIYPTDTIYGIGCDATNPEAVKKLRDIKSRYKRPFSVIAPSKEWIIENCEVGKREEDLFNKLPGPYTLILKLKNNEVVAPETNNDLGTLGIRIPAHWFSKMVAQLGVPIVTTSANYVGADYMTSLEDLDPKIKAKMKFCVYEGEKKGHPSTLVDLTKEELDILKR